MVRRMSKESQLRANGGDRDSYKLGYAIGRAIRRAFDAIFG